jgi:hypothetical protein
VLIYRHGKTHNFHDGAAVSADNDFRRQVFALAAEGLSQRAIGRALDSNHVTVAKILREPPPPPPEAMPAHCAPRPPPATPGTDSPDAPALQVVRELLAEARNQFAVASASGDSASAQRYARTAAGLTPVLARLEREDREVDGAVRISPAEAAKIQDSLTERIRAIINRPLVCSTCSRALSVFWGTGLSSEADLDAADGAHETA